MTRRRERAAWLTTGVIVLSAIAWFGWRASVARDAEVEAAVATTRGTEEQRVGRAAPVQSAPPPARQPVVSTPETATADTPGRPPHAVLRVLEFDGRPAADAPVRITLGDPTNKSNTDVRFSNADGWVRVRRAMQERGELAGVASVQASLDLPLTEPVRSQVALAPNPGVELPVLRVPPTGTVHILVEPLHDAIPTECLIRLEPARRGDRRSDRRWSRFVKSADEFVVERVGLGQSLVAHASLDIGNVNGSAVVVGPKTHGSRVTVRVRLGGTSAILVARLQDERGEAIRSELLSVWSTVETQPGVWSRPVLMRTGLSPSAVMAHSVLGPTSTSIAHRVEVFVEAPVLRSAKVELGPLPAGVTDLGVLTLRGPPLLAAGVVFSESGHPVWHARVEALRAKAATGLDGRFELRGVAPTGELQLTVSAVNHCPTTVAVRHGAQDVEVCLDRSAALRGHLQVPPGRRPRDYRFELVSTVPPAGATPGSAASPQPAPRSVTRSGRFVFDPVRPGSYFVRIRQRESGTTLAESETVRLDPGRTTRIRPIDLR